MKFSEPRAWSNRRMKEMLAAANIILPPRFLSKLGNENFNLLGDWLWCELHELSDNRPKKLKMPPKFLDEHLPRNHILKKARKKHAAN